MKKAYFNNGTHLLFTLLEIPYGHILIDGDEADGTIYNLQFGRRRIQQLLSSALIAQEDVAELEQQMVASGMVETEADMFAKVTQWETPTGFIPDFAFLVHTRAHPIPHGHVQRISSGASSQVSIFTIFEGLMGICEVIQQGHMTPGNGANLLKQMIQANLAKNNRDLRQRTKNLTADVREMLVRLDS